MQPKFKLGDQVYKLKEPDKIGVVVSCPRDLINLHEPNEVWVRWNNDKCSTWLFDDHIDLVSNKKPNTVAHDKWEYEVIEIRDFSPFKDRLNQYGNQGWELCAIECNHFVFKRKK